MLKSYYEVLNVSENAKKSEIKAQFRKMVRMYHPDINSSLEAEIIFKEINKAADVLLDNEKRKKYDELRSKAAPYTKTQNKNYENASNYTFSDLFHQKNKKEDGIKEAKKIEPKDGDDITVSVTIDYSEAVLGTTRTVNIARAQVCPKCQGKKFANGTRCSFCDGLGEKTDTRKITVKIPPAIKNKTKLRLKGEGQFGKHGGKNGNLYIEVEVKKTQDFEIKDGIVYSVAKINPYLAVLGGSLTVSTLWGDKTIKIPPLTKANQSFKLIDAGILNEKTNKKGEQIVTIEIQIPSKLTDEEIYFYEKLKEADLKKINARTYS